MSIYSKRHYENIAKIFRIVRAVLKEQDATENELNVVDCCIETFIEEFKKDNNLFKTIKFANEIYNKEINTIEGN